MALVSMDSQPDIKDICQKCGSDDAGSVLSSGNNDGYGAGVAIAGWSKKKRSFRVAIGTDNSASSEVEELANCLMMLSNAPMPDTEGSCASAMKDEQWGIHESKFRYGYPLLSSPQSFQDKAKGISTKGVFECKACKKMFNSHQALGGHRASHKKVKGCFAARLDDFQYESNHCHGNGNTEHDTQGFLPLVILKPSSSKSKVHECSICHRVFNSGQALGGHKRCHWITSNNENETASSTLGRFNRHRSIRDQVEYIQPLRAMMVDKSEPLDLNFPTVENPLSFEVSTDIFLKPWIETDEYYLNNSNLSSKDGEQKNNNIEKNEEVENEGKGIKLAKLYDLKDLNNGCGELTPWLQVGIASTTDEGDES